MPAWLAAAALGGSALASIFGSRAASKTSDANEDIARMNIKAEERARADTIAEARRMQALELEESQKLRDLQLQMYNTSRDDALFDQLYARAQQSQARMDALRAERETKLGSTDAAGNRQSFVPGQGWVTELSPAQEALRVDSETEQQRQLTEGAARDAQTGMRANVRRGSEDLAATEADRTFREARRPDVGALRQLFLARGAEQRNRNNDAVGDVIARQGIRAGGGANAAELMQRARGASDESSARDAGVEAELAARAESERSYGASRDRSGQLYDYFRRMSTSGDAPPTSFTPSTPGVPGSPVNVGAGSGSVPSRVVGTPGLSPISSRGSTDQMLLSALGRSSQQPYQQPDYSTADMIAGASNSLFGLAQYYQNQKVNDAILDRFGSNTGSFG